MPLRMNLYVYVCVHQMVYICHVCYHENQYAYLLAINDFQYKSKNRITISFRDKKEKIWFISLKMNEKCFLIVFINCS